MNVDPDKGVFEYEVCFEPEIDSKDFRFKLLNQHKDVLGLARTFDGVTLYLPFLLPNSVCINLLRDEQTFFYPFSQLLSGDNITK